MIAPGHPIRILIVDDHAVVRQGVRKILTEQPDMEILGEAENAEQLEDVIDSMAWDVMILDISLPGRSGLDIMKDIHQRYPRRYVLFLSMLPEEQFALRVMKAGAAGYLAKGTAPEQLVAAVRKIAAGKKYISPELAETLASSLDVNIEKLPHERLSEREFQVLRKIATGKTLTSIAQELYLSLKTVATYRARILAKMGMRSNAELTRYAIEHKLIE